MSEETEEENKGSSDQLDPETEKLLVEDFTKFEQILSNNSEIEHWIHEILNFHLKGSIDNKTYSIVSYSLRQILGENASRFIVNYLANPSIFEIPNKIFDNGNFNKVLPTLQYLSAIYGYDMVLASEKAGKLQDDLKMFNANANYNTSKNEWFIDIDLRTYKEHTFSFKITPRKAAKIIEILSDKIQNINNTDIEIVGESELIKKDILKKYISSIINNSDTVMSNVHQKNSESSSNDVWKSGRLAERVLKKDHDDIGYS